MRIEFVAVDVNNDGDYVDENEGFMRVYRANGTDARPPELCHRPPLEHRLGNRPQR